MRRIVRRWIKVVVTLLVAIVFGLAVLVALQLRNRPQIDITFTGAISGRMTEIDPLPLNARRCSVSSVQGTDQRDADFTSVVNGKRAGLLMAITPYHGPGTYSSPGIPDAARLATMSPSDVLQSTFPVHIGFSGAPASMVPAPEYATEPGATGYGASLAELTPLAGLGKATITLNNDRKSGHVEALLMNASTPTAPPLRLKGSFKCS